MEQSNEFVYFLRRDMNICLLGLKKALACWFCTKAIIAGNLKRLLGIGADERF